MVVQAVEAIVGEEAEPELLVVAANLGDAGCGAWQASRRRAGPYRCKAPLRSSETVPSKTAWPVGACRSVLLEPPPMTRSSIGDQSRTAAGSLKSKSSSVSSGRLAAANQKEPEM